MHELNSAMINNANLVKRFTKRANCFIIILVKESCWFHSLCFLNIIV